METARHIARLALCAAAALAASTLADAGTLYKSVDSQGRVTFSDVPVDGAVTVQRIASSDTAKPAESGGAPVYLALADSFDEIVAQANAKVDMAEHALALARRGRVEDTGMLLGPPLTRGEAQRLEFFKRDVVAARRNLLRVLQQRNALYNTRPLA